MENHTIFTFLQDAKSVEQLIHVLERKILTTSNDVKLFSHQFNDRKSFPSAFVDWIHLQSQPFTASRLYEPTTEQTVAPSSSGASPSTQRPAHMATTVGEVSISQSDISSQLADQGTKSAAKPKKRVTPNSVSSVLAGSPLSLLTTLQGNIASTPDSPAEPSSLLNEREQVAKMLAASSTPDQSISRNDTTKSKPTPEVLKQTPPPYVVIIRDTPPGGLAEAKETKDWETLVDRLSAVFVALVMNQYVLIADALQLLAKLCSLPLPPSGRCIIVQADHEQFPTVLRNVRLMHQFVGRCACGLRSLLCVLGDAITSGFAESAILRKVAPGVARDLSSAVEDAKGSEFIEDINFNLPDNFIRPFREDIDSRNEYKSRIETAAYNERERYFDDFSNLIRHFQSVSRSDVDGSSTLCFWETDFPPVRTKIAALQDCNYVWFADIFVKMLLFHGLNTATTSASVSVSMGAGCSPSSTPSSSPLPSPKDDGLPSSSLMVQSFLGGPGAGISTPVHGGRGVSLPFNRGAPSPLTNNITPHILRGNDPLKHRRLEERMGPGGQGYSSGSTARSQRPASQYQYLRSGSAPGGNPAYDQPRRVNSVHNRHPPSDPSSGSGYVPSVSADYYREPSQLFPGNQQFFFRFLVLCNNHRLSRCVEETLAAEVAALSEHKAAQPNTPTPKASTGRRDTEGDSANSSPSPSYSGRAHRHASFSTDADEAFSSPFFQPISASSAEASDARCCGPSDLDSLGLDGLGGLPAQEYAGGHSLALRVARLRILGKFLGLLTFSPQWMLGLTPADRGPLRTLAIEAARLRGALRPALTYPLRQIVERAYHDERLVYVVPWVGEFLKMMVWDPIYTERSLNPYFEVLGALRTVQRSEMLHPGKGKLSSTRLFVLMEIQNLWPAVAISPSHVRALPLTSVPKKNTCATNAGMGSGSGSASGSGTAVKSYYPRYDDFDRADDQNTAFSASFLHHVTPALSDVVKAFRRKQRPASKAAPAVATPGPGAAVVATATKRQTPYLVSATGVSGVSPSVLFGSSSFVSLSSPPPANGRPATAGTVQCPPQLSTPTKGVHDDSASRQVATSLMAKFSAAVKSTTTATTSARGPYTSPRIEATLANGAEWPSLPLVEASSPPGKATSPRKPADSTTTGSAGKVVRRRSVSSTASGVQPSPSLLLLSSPSHEGASSPKGRAVVPPTPPDSGPSSITDKLVVAFWQQHPQLQQMSGFLLEHMQKAGLARLRGAVADAVVTLWARSATLKLRAEGAHRTVLAATPSPSQDVIHSLDYDHGHSHSRGHGSSAAETEFARLLEAEKDAVFAATVSDGSDVLQSLVEHRLSNALQELLALYPCNERVTRLAVWLIRRQARAQRGPLLNYLSSYLSRKLAEVVEASIKQAKKAIDEMGSSGRDGSTCLSPTIGDSGCDRQTAPTPAWLLHRSPKDGDESSPNSVSAAVSDMGSDAGTVEAAAAPSPHAMAALTGAFKEINLFFSAPTSAFTSDTFTTAKVAPVVCRGPAVSEGASAVAFLNGVARLIEAVQALVLAVARCLAEVGVGSSCSSAHMRVMVENTCTLFHAMVRWTRTEKTHGVLLPHSSELVGKFSILLVKLLTLTAPALFYLDAVVRPLREKGCQLPSDGIWAFEDGGLITPESSSFILVTAARSSTMVYYTHCKGLTGLQAVVPEIMLAYIYRYYHLRKPSSFHPHGTVKWYNDMDKRSDIKTVLGNEVFTIVANLMKIL